MLRRRRRSGSEGDESKESSDEIFESDTDEEPSDGQDELSDVLNSSSDDELDVVIEETKSSSVPTVLDLVISVEASQLVPGIRLCLAWLGADMAEGVLGQTGPGSEQLWHNLARMLTVGRAWRPALGCERRVRTGCWPGWWTRLGCGGREREVRPTVLINVLINAGRFRPPDKGEQVCH